MATKEKKSIPFLQKRWLKIIGVLALLGIAFLIALPYGIRYGVQRWLENNGAQSVEIKKVRLNLFSGTASIDGLKVKLDDDVVLGDAGMRVDLRLASLFKKEAHLQTGLLSGLILDVELSEDGSLRIGSISIPASSGDAANEDSGQATDVSWFFRASHVELADCLIRFKMPGLQHKIYVKKATLSNLFTGVSEEPSHLELEGKINETPISLTLDRIEISSKNDRVIGGHIKIDGYKLGNMKGLLQGALDSFTGSASLDGMIQASIGDDGSFDARYQGSLSVIDADIGSSDFSIQSPSISYKGEIQYDLDKDLNMLIDVNGALQGTDTTLAVPAANLDLLEEQLLIDGKTQVTISKDIDISVVTDAALTLGEFALNLPPMKMNNSTLGWQGHVEYKLAGDSGNQSVNTDGKAVLQKSGYSMKSADFTMNTSAEELSWQGKVDIDLGSEQSPMTITADGMLKGDSHQLAIADLLELKEDALSVDGTTVITVGNKINVAHTGRKLQIDNTAVTVAGTTSSGSLSWQGQADYSLEGDASKILLNGTLKGKELATLLEEQKILIKQQDLTITTHKVSLKIGEQIKLGGKAALKAKKLQVESDGSPLVQLEQTTVQGLTGTSAGGLQVDTVTFSSLEVTATETQPIDVSVPEITFTNLVSTDFSGATVDTLKIKQATVRDTANKTLLAKIDSVTGTNIKADASATISLDSLATGKGTFLKKDGKKTQPQATLAKVNVKKITWSNEGGLFIDRIALNSLYARYDKIKSPAKKNTKKKQAEKKDKEDTAMVPIQINSIAITGKSALRFTDQTLTTPFLATLALEKVQVKNINSKKTKAPLSYMVKGKIDKYAPLDITGTATPFAKDLQVDAKIELRNYSMQLLSPYVTDAIGTKFNKGQLTITSGVKIAKGHLNLENHLVMQDIEAETVSDELLEKLNNELPVSLDMALSMLRDRNDDITLSIPVSGPMDHLSVNPTDIIVTALSKAIGIAVTPYLAYTVLGPAGALAYVGMKAGQAMLDTRFPTLEFENQATALTDAHKETLKKVGELMEDHKDTDYSICSKVLLWELAGNVERNFDNQQKILKDKDVRKQLLVIGGKRAENVRQYLLDEFSIDKDHLLICSPNIDFEPDGKPIIGFRD